MAIRYFALVYGIVFLAVGILGFVPAFLSAHGLADPELAITAGSGLLLGLFPVNVLHNLVHIIFGIWGLVAYKALKPAVTYARAVAVVYAVFVVMGFIPVLQTTFGLVPLYGHNIWLHLILAAGGAYFGWFANAQGEPRKA
ncbi:DUF4383 domain-containing protein [Marinobacter salicampi]|uniref:DUF4383 domain-containing protein n=1 Tax=Marinobacter salicampi TaxID=435907 RepID=UPI00140A46C9|nr:DUF4383 domain-containing protein [Marinobacter salicampi]